MKKGILGKKLGMTQVFTKQGKMIPVTVVSVEPNVITQIKTTETDGYDAIQLGFSDKREKLASKAAIGHTNKAKTKPKRFLREIKGADAKQYQLGQTIDASIFEPGETVDVVGISKGKGFQGVIKRHNFSRGPMSHGSHFHRRPGSLGSMRPKRVFKGKKMPGHMGAEQVTIQNLEIVMVDLENNVILVSGNVPGPKKSMVLIQTAVKQSDKKTEAPELNFYEPITEQEVSQTEEVEQPEENSEATEEVEQPEENNEAAEETTEEETDKKVEQEEKNE